MPQQFFEAKKKRLFNLGNLALEPCLPGVGEETLDRAHRSARGQIPNAGTT